MRGAPGNNTSLRTGCTRARMPKPRSRRKRAHAATPPNTPRPAPATDPLPSPRLETIQATVPVEWTSPVRARCLVRVHVGAGGRAPPAMQKMYGPDHRFAPSVHMRHALLTGTTLCGVPEHACPHAHVPGWVRVDAVVTVYERVGGKGGGRPKHKRGGDLRNLRRLASVVALPPAAVYVDPATGMDATDVAASRVVFGDDREEVRERPVPLGVRVVTPLARQRRSGAPRKGN